MGLSDKLKEFAQESIDNTKDVYQNNTQEERYIKEVKPIKQKSNSSMRDRYNLGSESISRHMLSKSTFKDNKSSKKTNIFEDFMFDDEENVFEADIANTISSLAGDLNMDMADEFDAFLDNDELTSSNENAELRDNLISMGRRYARDNAASREMSAISKSFAESEKRLRLLYDELDKDKAYVQKDLERLRIPQRGNSKLLSDLASVKNSLQNSQLSIVKEINSLRKSIYDLQSKDEAKKNAEALGSSDINSNTLQSIFASAKSGMMNNVGGYSGISGAISNNDDPVEVYREMDDETIHDRYFNSDDGDYSVEEDGDIYLRYEGKGVEYILLVDEDRKVQEIIAEDNEGNIVPDYPMPSNIDSLIFEISQKGNHATDNLHRNYKVRTI